jgi:hypothetical protein
MCITCADCASISVTKVVRVRACVRMYVYVSVHEYMPVCMRNNSRENTCCEIDVLCAIP